MRKPDLSKLERIVAAAEARAVGSTTDQRSGLRAIESKAAVLLSTALPQFDKAGLEQLQCEHDAELRRLAEAARRRTVEGAAEASRRLDAMVAAERVALDTLPADPFGPGSIVLPKVDFIRSWPTPGNLRDSHQAPGVNWAKYAVDSGDAKLGHFHEKISFYNVWQNPRDVPVLVDVLVRLTVYGHLECSAQGGGVSSWFFWAGVRSSKAQVSAQLSLWGLWVEPAPIYLVDSIPLGNVSATGGFFGDSNGTTIQGPDPGSGIKPGAVTPAVSTTGFAVPAGASILIEASLAVDYELEFGSVKADFASENLYTVGWAYAVVTLPQNMMVSG